MKLNKLDYRKASKEELDMVEQSLQGKINLLLYGLALFILIVVCTALKSLLASLDNLVASLQLYVPVVTLLITLFMYLLWKDLYYKKCVKRRDIYIADAVCIQKRMVGNSGDVGIKSYRKYEYVFRTSTGETGKVKEPEILNGTIQVGSQFLVVSFGKKKYAFIKQ